MSQAGVYIPEDLTTGMDLGFEAGPADTIWGSGSSAAREVTIRVQTPQPSFSEKLYKAFADMREIARNRVGHPHVGETPVRFVSFADDDDDGGETDLYVLSIRLNGVSMPTRMDVQEALLSFLARHEDSEMRQNLSVEIC
jgi:hypothetical protein